MKRKLPEKFFEQNQRAKTRKWKFFNLNQALWGAGNREFRDFSQKTRLTLASFSFTIEYLIGLVVLK